MHAKRPRPLQGVLRHVRQRLFRARLLTARRGGEAHLQLLRAGWPALAGAPPSLQSMDARFREFPNAKFLLQVAPEDCTGCGLCVAVCPAVFRVNDAGFIEVADLDAYPEDEVNEAIKHCPADCIRWEEE